MEKYRSAGDFEAVVDLYADVVCRQEHVSQERTMQALDAKRGNGARLARRAARASGSSRALWRALKRSHLAKSLEREGTRARPLICRPHT